MVIKERFNFLLIYKVYDKYITYFKEEQCYEKNYFYISSNINHINDTNSNTNINQ